MKPISRYLPYVSELKALIQSLCDTEAHKVRPMDLIFSAQKVKIIRRNHQEFKCPVLHSYIPQASFKRDFVLESYSERYALD